MLASEVSSANSTGLKVKTETKKVFLAIPPSGVYLRDDRCQTAAWTMPRPPMNLAYAAAFLELDGHQCVIRDCPAEKTSWENLESELGQTKPDVLFINFTMPTLEQDVRAFQIAKKIRPDLITVAKGADLYINDTKIFEACKEIDIAIRGEVDFVVQDIFRNLDNLDAVNGITYRSSNGQIIRNPNREWDKDLDAFPFPARHLLNNDLYLRPDSRKKLGFVYTAKGCPSLCTFCAVPQVTGRKLRRRSVENVVEEIKHCQKTHDTHDFFFFADTFTLDKRWVMRLCQAFLDEKLNIGWACNSRVDSIDLEMARMMKKAGCDVVSFGAESGNDETLKQIKKGANTRDCETAIKVCREAGLRSMMFLMIGMPGETRENILETIEFSKRLDPDYIEYNIAQTFPGTEMADEVEKRGVKQRGDNILEYQQVSLSEHCDLEELKSLLKQGIFKFHFRPKYIIKSLLRMRSLNEALNHFTHAIWRFTSFFLQK